MEVVNEFRVAEITGLAVGTLRNWRCRGEGPPFIKMGTRVRYSVKSIEAWMAEREVRSTSEKVPA